MQLFRRVGRGVVPTTVADTLRPHAERVLAAAEDARRGAGVKSFETGTIRFGMFGIARLYAGAGLVADVLERHPGVRVELIGQNSTEVQEDLRRGRIEAAMIAIPQVTSEGMEVSPVARDELVYISADPERLAAPVTAKRLGAGSLVMPDTTWRAEDSVRHPAAPDAARDRAQPADPDRGRGPRDRGRAGRAWGSPTRWFPRARPSSSSPGWRPNAGWVSLRPRLVRHVRDRAPGRGDPLPRRAADDRAGDEADPGDRGAALGSPEADLRPERKTVLEGRMDMSLRACGRSRKSGELYQRVLSVRRAGMIG